MSALDPSYIRSIRDGIINGNIEANNQEALPDGLVGLYDRELFPPTMKWKERKEALHFFLVFALAQKEISADFAATILGDEWYNLQNEKDTEQDKRLQKVNSLIQLHSKRFSSAGGGKYRLYHERFRLYILQKVSEQDIAQFNNKFITLCETALETYSLKNISDNEIYALQFLSNHLLFSALMQNAAAKSNLLKLPFNADFSERQVFVSNGFNWSKLCIRNASYFLTYHKIIQLQVNDDILIIMGNKLIELYYREVNDSFAIIELLKENKPELALQRIETFGGKSEYDQEKRFVLIILCMIEIINSSIYGVSKTSLLFKLSKKLLEEETKGFSHEDVIPHKIIFDVVCFLDRMGLDYTPITSKIINWKFNWINIYSEFDESSIAILILLLTSEKEMKNKNSALSMLSFRLCYLGKFDEAIEILNMITEDYEDVEFPF